ncbi:FtsX-like permease family protein [Stenotrophomonas sp. MMGLT7]|uniref:ABC transporter permease n=1 Tax=Stenotrophomonas sp. MMGLT7 TaxID=2901227 RepID=UPI001E3C0088|nr:FtsX-like permease family protein [Stenotrophomonas sp. MMGLT7]MCD7099231.1 ABC transporter permease [Stenotrophomonas sp. MMGLT7]
MLSMPFPGPIVAPLLRQRLMPLLLVVQIALACAILANALFLLGQRLAPMLLPDGIARGELLLVDQLIGGKGPWNGARIRAGTDALRAVPGVRAVSPALGLPMLQSMTMAYDLTGPSGVAVNASAFAGENLVQTLGLELVQGRDFDSADYSDTDLSKGLGSRSSPVILTAALARKLFPDGGALGGVLPGDEADGSDSFVVVGIVRHLLRYQIGELDDGKAEYSILLPHRIVGTPILSYAVRVDPAQREAAKAAIPALLKRDFGDGLLRGIEPKVEDYESLRREAFRPRRAAVWLLGTVSAVVALITAIGIASLTGYWIDQRTRQIGIRRALGATRGQILRHFQAENLLLTLLGLLLGMPLAYAANLWLMQYYELPRLPLHYLPVGAALLWGLGQFAVFWPARRAAAVPPAVATRSA